MSVNEKQDTAVVIDSFVHALTSVLSKGADPCPKIETKPALAAEPVTWFKQTFGGAPDVELFVGVPETAASKITGPLLSEVFAGLAESWSAATNQDLSCLALADEPPPPGFPSAILHLEWPSAPPADLHLAFSGAISDFLAAGARKSKSPAGFRHLDVLMDMDLPVSISFGSVDVPMGEVLKLSTGSIIQLSHPLGDPVDVVVNDCLVARGEVVVVDGNYGVRVVEVVSGRDGMKWL